MTDATDGAPVAKRGHAAWKEAQDAVSKRNDDAHKSARKAQGARDDVRAQRDRREADREAKHLEKLNKKIAGRGRSGKR